MSTISHTATIGDELFTYEDAVDHASNQRRIILCRSTSGDLRYVEEHEWRNALAATKQTTPLHHAPDLTTASVTHTSPRAEKIALIMSLFRGRTDVYGAGFTGKTTKEGKLSYWPKCNLRHIRGACPKQHNPKMPCSACDHPKYDPLTPEIVESHCKGTDARGRHFAIGIYVVEVDHCYFLAADFDGPGWMRAAAGYRDTCRQHDLCPAVERSRSGNGAHVWVFFNGPIPASVARRAGEGLISEARKHCPEINFASYDRLFPLQDVVTPGNLGSLIALPLQGEAVRKGNSVFVDDNFNPYQDQCAYLSSLTRANTELIAQIANECGSDPIGLPRSTDKTIEYVSRTNTLSKSRESSLAFSMSTEVFITLSDGIHISRNDLPTQLVDQLCRLAAFRNPAFSKNIRLHLSTRDVPRFIDLSVLHDDELVLPRGCLPAVLALLNHEGIKTVIIDERTTGKQIHANFQGQLRPLQAPCKDSLINEEMGVLVAPTGFGKSVIAASIIAHHNVSTLVIVPTVSLLEQWRTSLQKFLDIADEPPILLTPKGRKKKKQPGTVGIIGGGEHLPSGIVDIALVGSLFEKGSVEGDTVVSPLIHDYGMVIVDEVQHVPAGKPLQVLQSLTARYVYGMTATPKRDDSLDRIIFLECGPLRYEVDIAEQVQEQGMRRLLIPRFTYVRPNLDETNTWHSLVDYICINEERNNMIINDAIAALDAGRTPLVLTRRVDHARELASGLQGRIPNKGAHVALLIGQDAKSVKKQQLEDLRSISDDAPLCVVATGNYVGEGFDLDRLDTLLLAGPVAFEGALAQWVGRLHRVRPGKAEVFVLDYIDSSIPMFDNEWKTRLRSYTRLKYSMAQKTDFALVGLNEATAPDGHLFGYSDFAHAFDSDLALCRRSLTISSSWSRLRRIDSLSTQLKELISRDVTIRVVLRKPKQHTLEWNRILATLQTIGADITASSTAAHLDFAIIDESVVWYGSIAPLGFPRKDDCSIRFVSREVAAELNAQVDDLI